MGFNVFYENAMFFVGITLILLGKSNSKNAYFPSASQDNPYSDSSNSTPNYPQHNNEPNDNTPYSTKKLETAPRPVFYSLHARPQSKNLSIFPEENTYVTSSLMLPESQKSSGSAECPPLRRGAVIRDLLVILSPEIFTQPDPFRYLVEKTMKLLTPNIKTVTMEVDKLLRYDRLPECYIPYAKALLSLLQCWPNLNAVKINIRAIRKQFPANKTDSSFLPSDISSSISAELLQLFSDDFLGDPTPPLRIFYWLLDMPKSSVVNLEAQLKKFIERSMKSYANRLRNHYYIRYAQLVWKFIQDESAFDNLKREMAAIQQTGISDQLMPATSTLLDPSATQV